MSDFSDIDFTVTRTKLSIGHQTCSRLLGELQIVLDATIWNPDDVSGLTTVNLIEVKAMLINARKKLTKIAIREGYIEK